MCKAKRHNEFLDNISEKHPLWIAARARRGCGRVNGDSALKQPAPACCTSKKRRNATASSKLSYKTRAAHAPRQAKQVQTRTGRQ